MKTSILPDVKVGQIFCDNDKRSWVGMIPRPNRFLRVERIIMGHDRKTGAFPEFAECVLCFEGGTPITGSLARKVRISIRRMKPNSTGFTLVGQV